MAQALGAKQERQRQQQERQRQNALNAAKFLLESGQVADIADVQPLLGIAMPDVFGETAKKPKAGQVDPSKTIGDILNKSLSSSKGQPMLPGPAAQQPPTAAPAPAGDNLQPGGALDTGAPVAAPTALQSRPIAIPAAPAAQRSLGGVPLLTPEQAAQRKLSLDIAGQQAQIEAKVALARRILPTLQALDKTATLDDAMAAVGIRLPRTEGVSSFSEVPGEVDGKPVTGILDHRTGQIIDPITREPIKGFIHRQTVGSTSLGADRESIARELFGKRAADLSGSEMEQVNKTVEERAASKAGAVTTARGESAAKSPLSSAQRFNALRDLQGDWRKADAPVKETARQLQIMETGIKRFKGLKDDGTPDPKGPDKNGGSQAVLVTFQKILDPNSVVRESEYDRSPEGLGLKQRMVGFIDRLQGGGAGVPEPELEAMVETARQFVKGLSDYNAIERERITQAAKEAGLDPERVFGVASAPTSKTGTGTKTTTPSTAGAVMKDGHLYIDGVKID